ncbi:S-layer homology domain-containing protein, partial [Agathobaculum sp.]|uniref:S-layer homology domain-containing protein n=1 Tax=Agathobaculum sp. TaxID=2048138 RepID=UPI0039A3EA6F
MKKMVSACFACILLTFAAGAADVGTIDNGYPGDTEAQAQMLCDLGLFRGTENGFELEKPMTRAEAAAMLTRFLGAEQEALAGEWEHPFTDVPQWAEPYVGWLYESGLTKGVSGTVYGAGEDVTCGQYCTFLARASTDEDYYDFLLRFGEREE